MRNKKSRKLVSILITLTMLVTLLVPMVGPASAATNYSMTSVNKIKAPFQDNVGNLVITMDGASVLASASKFVIFDLPTTPSGYEIFPDLAVDDAMEFTATNQLGDYVTVTKKSNTEFRVDIADNVADINNNDKFDSSKDALISIPLQIKVPSGISGEINLTASAKSSSTFSSGTITVAKVGVSSATLAVENVPTIKSSNNSSAAGIIDIKEDTMGALLNSGSRGTADSADPADVSSDGSYALKLTLPPGFSWENPNVEMMWGDDALVNNVTFNTDNNNGRELDVSVPSVNGFDGSGNAIGSSSASFLKLSSNIAVDDSVAKAGDITVKVSGAVSATPTDLLVGKYGDYSSSIKAFSAIDVVAGKVAQDIGKVEVDEAVSGSLQPNRTVTFTLPDNIKWSQLPTIDPDNSTNYGDISVDWQVVDSDARMIKGTFNNSTENNSDAAKIVFKNMQVTPAIDFSGDLTVAVAGSEGLSGDLVLGKVNSAITVKADTTPDVKIGVAGQALGDLTITENMAGALNGTVNYSEKSDDKLINSTTEGGKNGSLILKAPAGVTFDGTPTVAVTDGDLQISANGISTDTTNANEGVLYVKIKSSSTTASTIKISGIKLVVNRTIPEGSLSLKAEGDALNETLDVDGTDNLFPGRNSAATFVVANCVTPAQQDTKTTTVFKIGDTNFTSNGVAQTLDAAPYIKGDRTYLPIRFVAKSVGVDESNIMWNAAEQSVVLVKGDRVVKLVIGSTNMLINGVAVTMDAAPEVVDPGRTMLPVRWVAQALGANIQWDAATQTVTIN